MVLNSKNLQTLEKKVSEVVIEAGKITQKRWEEPRELHFKSHEERVTQFDPYIETFIRERLTRIFPEAGFFVEEGKNSDTKEYMWSIDPIDGTNNFIGRIPLFYIQVALVYKDSPILGILFNPISNQLFSASLKNGAKVNGKLITAQTEVQLEKAIIDMDFGAHNNGLYWKIPVFKTLCEKCHKLRISGGMYGAYIAFGGIDAYVVVNETTKVVDQMPRIIWMKELGLKVEQFEINGHKIILSTNAILFPKLKKLVKQALLNSY